MRMISDTDPKSTLVYGLSFFVCYSAVAKNSIHISQHHQVEMSYTFMMCFKNKSRQLLWGFDVPYKTLHFA